MLENILKFLLDFFGFFESLIDDDLPPPNAKLEESIAYGSGFIFKGIMKGVIIIIR